MQFRVASSWCPLEACLDSPRLAKDVVQDGQFQNQWRNGEGSSSRDLRNLRWLAFREESPRRSRRTLVPRFSGTPPKDVGRGQPRSKATSKKDIPHVETGLVVRDTYAVEGTNPWRFGWKREHQSLSEHAALWPRIWDRDT